MELVLAHRNMDFDCLASQLAVVKLNPSCHIALAHPIPERLKQFLSFCRDQLPIVDLNYLQAEQIKHIYLVDCQKVDRLDDRARRFFENYLSNSGSFTIYDHHISDAESLIKLATSDSEIRSTGAAASILVSLLRKNKVKLSNLEATIIAAGIYEDSGCLTHRETTEEDALAIAFCLANGANLEQVNSLIRTKFSEEQSHLFELLVKSQETLSFGSLHFGFFMTSIDHYLEGLGEITGRLLENYPIDVALAIVKMKDRVHLVGRSEKQNIDLRKLANAFGGGGHAGAIAASLKGKEVAEIKESVLALLSNTISFEPTAIEIMHSPVRTILPDTSMDEAGKIMIRFGLDGLVVYDSGNICGIISKRDVDKAKYHKLAHAPVRGFMSHPVIFVHADTKISEIRQLMIKESIGRVPVLDEQNQLLGIIGRQEIFQILFDNDSLGISSSDSLKTEESKGSRDFGELSEDKFCLESYAHPELLEIYKEIGTIANKISMPAYLVGGCVRDIFLQRENYDIDIVVEGSAKKLAQELVTVFCAKYEIIAEHKRFDTATLRIKTMPGRELDLATARIEFYDYPAALPTVEPSSLKQDLFRRDFTINALAMSICPNDFGRVIDYYNGIFDLQNCKIKVLHQFSFIEDPTRIIRAVRFASRLNFNIEAKTQKQAERAIALGIFDNLGGVRLKEEVRLVLESSQRLKALDLLAELGGGLKFLDADLIYTSNLRRHIRYAEKLIFHYKLTCPWIIYLGVLLAELPKKNLQDTLERLHLAQHERSVILDAHAIILGLIKLNNSVRKSELYRVLHGHEDQSLAISFCIASDNSDLRRAIKIYFEELKNIKTSLNGNDLLEMGISEGPILGKVLSRLQDAKIDGKLPDLDSEKKFVLECISETT